jgi:integrase
MSILTFEITREEWLENVYRKSKSMSSKKAYDNSIKKWDDYLESIKKTDADVLTELKAKNNDPESYLFLNNFIQYLSKQNLTRKSIDLIFVALKSWCAANGVMLFNEYVKRFVQMPKANKETKQPLTPEIIKQLITNSPNQIKVVLLTLLSSGMRIGECLQIKVKDVNVGTNPIQIRLRASTTKTREERIAYISKEAWEMVRPLLNGKDPDDLVFVKNFTHTTIISFETRFSRVRRNLGLIEKYEGERNYHVNIHAFRANFETWATKVLNGDIAHALIGHRGYLDVYLRLTPQEKADMYHKLEPYVTVSDESRLRTIVADKDTQLKELSKMQQEIMELKAFKKRQEDKK